MVRTAAALPRLADKVSYRPEVRMLILWVVSETDIGYRRIVLLLAIEYAWNVFPSTILSSAVLFISNATLITGIWFGYPEGIHPEQKGKID